LAVFARKPAPIQASWIGYPGTTGMQSMDYYIADRHFLPLDVFASQFKEKFVYLPATAPFLPFVGSPPVNELPTLNGSPFTFGSFNRANKLNRSVISLWSKLLHAVPNARMFVAGLAGDHQADVLSRWLREEGIALERLTFTLRSEPELYLRMYHEVDLCLDTFPYSGGTTTHHALWMGVPTLTLAGQTPASRQTASLLAHVRLDAFVATSEDEFIRIGQDWVRRKEDLAEIRAGLRARLESSPICNANLISTALAQALRVMWRRWCVQEPVELIDVTHPK